MFVRDAGNSVEDDPYFPFSRSFDWFNGHSWAKGLFESFDGKDQESTSEDTITTTPTSPPNFIGNKVTGILFENKVDHTTWFGSNLEFIQGIHMLPLPPNSSYTRQPQFVTEEWQAMFAPNASTPAANVDGGWKGVLFANLTLIDPQASWDFFAQSKFDYSWIDGGASRTWYLAYTAGLGGGP
ncbi:Glycoside hydrolasefamily 81 [Penicillium desertorum]|uniref:glucan endo-1,3-beta-D-glucosidase n=1 Tax=Penicillium desertorum TaxID=1303715 RepID=A0A9W9WMN0_9EURO|nr:Glycoside hydrolasefamily 81 [Penicillium desertorum]